MAGKQAIHALLMALAKLYQDEGRAGATAAANALLNTANTLPETLPTYQNPSETQLRAGLSENPTEIAALVADAMPYIKWTFADLGENRLPDALSKAMTATELLGPDGMFPAGDVRVGIWMQSPNLTYGPRRHIAEETFHIIAGSALWSTEDTDLTERGSGDIVFHPSNILHTSITKQKPMITAWRWSGHIGFDGYQLKS